MPVHYTIYVENSFVGEEDLLMKVRLVVLLINNPLAELHASVVVVFGELLN